MIGGVGAAIVQLDLADVSIAAPVAGAPRIAMKKDGTGFVIVWQAADGGTAGPAGNIGIFAQIFNANWQPAGAAFRVNVTVNGSQVHPAVGIDASGNFVVAWEAYGQNGDAANDTNVYLRRFQANGTAIDSVDVLVNTTAALSQFDAAIAVDQATGKFAVAWSGGVFLSEDIFAKGYGGITVGASGAPTVTFPEVTVNNTAVNSDDQTSPDVAMDTAGNLVVVWQSYNQDVANTFGVYLRRVNANGTLNGGEVLVNTVTAGNQQFPQVGMDGSGNFTIVWESDGVDGSGRAVVMQRYNAAGVPLGSNTTVNTTTALNQTNPRIARASGGDFVITWQSAESDNVGSDIYYKKYDAAGATLIGETLVNSATVNDNQTQANPSVAIDDAGNFVVGMESGTATGFGVVLRRFADLPIVSISRDPASGATTLMFNTVPGQHYVVQFSDDLQTAFATLTSFTAVAGQFSATVQDSGAAGLPKRFYRVKIGP